MTNFLSIARELANIRLKEGGDAQKNSFRAKF